MGECSIAPCDFETEEDTPDVAQGILVYPEMDAHIFDTDNRLFLCSDCYAVASDVADADDPVETFCQQRFN